MRYPHIRTIIGAALSATGILAMGGSTMATKKLRSYMSKRDFSITMEPSTHPIFVVQKHAASHLHYDLRLEDNGVLKSWAVPKGIPQDPAEKHLAIETEDHPLEYAHFAGIIPTGNYGAGTVEIWDNGIFKNITKNKNGEILPLSECLKKGRLKIELIGKKLQGTYSIIRTKIANKSNWLLFKMHTKEQPDSELSHGNKLLFPETGITKRDLFAYYRAISPWMLPYTKNRFVTMVRAPEGMAGEWFYQKTYQRATRAGSKKYWYTKKLMVTRAW